VQPKLPRDYGKMEWDYTVLEKHYGFIDVAIDEKKNSLVFTLALKKDQKDEVACHVLFYDDDGVKIYTTSLSIRPFKSFEKGDVIEATLLNLQFSPVNKDVWCKAVKVKFTIE
jgi:hypothetical protein